MRLFALTLLAVSVMPSPVHSQSLGGLYNANAKYRHHYRPRNRHHNPVNNPNRDKSPAIRLAQNDMEPFSQQEEVRYTVDISAYLQPMDALVDFPQPNYKPMVPIISEQELNNIGEIPVRTEKLPYYFICMGFMVIFYGLIEEFKRLRTCHKLSYKGLPILSNVPRLVRRKVRRHWMYLVRLHLPTNSV